MQLTQTLNTALLLSGVATATAIKRQLEPSFDRYNATLDDFSEYALSVAKSRIASNATCTADKLSVRKSWYSSPTKVPRLAHKDGNKHIKKKPLNNANTES